MCEGFIVDEFVMDFLIEELMEQKAVSALDDTRIAVDQLFESKAPEVTPVWISTKMEIKRAVNDL